MAKNPTGRPPLSSKATKLTDLGTLSSRDAAKLVMLTPEHLGQLSRDGWIIRRDIGRWDVIELVQGLIRYLRDEQRRSSKSAGDSAIRQARAKEIEVRT